MFAGEKMTAAIKIDFVSDVSCPWCVIGLLGLEQALDRVGALVEADIRFQPFELNPHMPPEGQKLGACRAKIWLDPPAIPGEARSDPRSWFR